MQRRRLYQWQADMIRNAYLRGISMLQLAECFNRKYETIWNLCRRKPRIK